MTAFQEIEENYTETVFLPSMVTDMPVAPLPVVSLADFNESEIPPRPWLVQNLLLRGHVHMLVGPGGSGKSLFQIQLSTALAANKDWAGWRPKDGRPLRALIINAEDDLHEMQRRLAACMVDMKISKDDLSDRLIVPPTVDDLVIAELDPATGRRVLSPLGDRIVQVMGDLKVDILSVDPFAETHTAGENDNDEIKKAMIVWRNSVARPTNAAVFLSHHTPKRSGGMAGEADAARGGSAITAITRVTSTLFTMTEEEAKAYSVPLDERNKYVRFDDAKMNYALASRTGKWFEKKSVLLKNGNEVVQGDWVGVLSPWKPPSKYQGTTYNDLNKVLDEIDAAEKGGEPFLKDPRSNRAGWKAFRGLIPDKQGQEIIKDWLKSGTLEIVSAKTDNRKSTDGLKVNNAKRPGSEVSC